MKKFVAFSFGALMALSFNACSDDDVANTTPKDDSDVAYIHVNIITNDDVSTRADNSTVNPVLEQGPAAEHQVNEIEFYFFNENKKFISMSEINTGFNFTNETDGGNVESQSGQIVIVPRYDVTNPPKYLITVLNPTEEIAMKEGDEMSKFFALADGAFTTPTTTYKNDSKKFTVTDQTDNVFVMTTSAYIHEDKTQPAYATYLDEKVKFYETEQEATDANAESYATIYVERLAAKVALDFDETNIKSKWTDATTNIFKLGNFDLTHDGTAKTTLYAKFLGWGLDGTAKKTYYAKHLNTQNSWADNLLGNANPWNDVQRFRSYWAESVYYSYTADSKNLFPEEYENKTPSSSETDAICQNGGKSYYKGFSLNFISADEMNGHKIGTEAYYCGENTNSDVVINSVPNIAGATTCALMLAQLVKLDENNAYVSAGDIVKFQGSYWEAEKLSEKFLEMINAKGYKYTTAEGQGADAAMELIAEDLTYVKDTNLLNGRVHVQIKDDITKNAVKWFTADNTEITTTAATLNTSLITVQGANPMVMFKDGWMYYYTPIYHLSTNSIQNGVIPEGYYGVVRNHWYDITITGFRKNSDESPYDPSNPEGNPDDPGYGPEGPTDPDKPIDPGHGIDDPDEPIVPTTEEDVKYYLGANINVLSWRKVSQGIKL
jgi:hypothetical protein